MSPPAVPAKLVFVPHPLARSLFEQHYLNRVDNSMKSLNSCPKLKRGCKRLHPAGCLDIPFLEGSHAATVA